MAYKGKNVPKGWVNDPYSVVIVETRRDENEQWHLHTIFRPTAEGLKDGRQIAAKSRMLAIRNDLEYRYRCGHIDFDDNADKCVIFSPKRNGKQQESHE